MKNNKLIAEFMGLSIKEGVCYYTDADDMFPMGKEVEEPYLPYATSWDWLMPVVNECLDVYHIEQMTDDIHFQFYDSLGDIKLTYQAVVAFIKKYNDEQ